MTKYTYPEMPMEANVWFSTNIIPPDPLDIEAIVACSLSPTRPEDFFRSTNPGTELRPTHIIRTAVDGRYVDNMLAAGAHVTFPCSVLEVPPSSGHHYIVVWAHIVGAGFSNEHHRLYVARYPDPNIPGPPFFRGWI